MIGKREYPSDCLSIKLSARLAIAFIFKASWQSQGLGKVLLMNAMDAVIQNPPIKALDQQDGQTCNIIRNARAYAYPALVGKHCNKGFVTGFMRMAGIGHFQDVRRWRARSGARQAKAVVRQGCQRYFSPESGHWRWVRHIIGQRAALGEALYQIGKGNFINRVIIAIQVTWSFDRRMPVRQNADRACAVCPDMSEQASNVAALQTFSLYDSFKLIVFLQKIVEKTASQSLAIGLFA